MDAERINSFCDLLTVFYRQYHHVYVPPYPEYQELYQTAAYVRQHKASLSPELIACLDDLQFDWLADNRTSRWVFNYYELKHFFQKHGHTDLPHKYTKNPRLGAWTYFQRSRKDKLSPKQISMLEELNFTWISSTTDYNPLYEKRWNGMFEKLKAFQAEHHHVMVPSSHPDKALAGWVVRQRKNKDHLSDQQRSRLIALGFIFDMQQQRSLEWEYMFQQLVLFKQRHGHCNVPSSHSNKRLANWVRAQRMMQDKLTTKHERKLQSIGFEFPTTKQSQRDQVWLQYYREAELFYKKHGHLQVQNEKLRQWLYKQKYRKPKEEYRQMLLKKIGIV